MSSRAEDLISALKKGMGLDQACSVSGYPLASALLRIQEGQEEADRVSRGVKARKSKEYSLSVYDAFMEPKRNLTRTETEGEQE